MKRDLPWEDSLSPDGWEGVAVPVKVEGLTILISSENALDRLLRPMSLPDLAEYTGITRQWLQQAAAREDDPLPTVQRGTKAEVFYLDFFVWYRRTYGVDGPRRGLDPVLRAASGA